MAPVASIGTADIKISAYPLLSKPLYAFALPTELLDILTVRSLAGVSSTPDKADNDNSDDTDDDYTSLQQQNATAGSSLTCQTCLGTTFENVTEQRNHFKSDWHRYNSKVSGSQVGAGSQGHGILTAQEFEEIDDDLSSLSGSASDSSTGSAPTAQPTTTKTDKIARLLRSQQLSGTSTPTADGSSSNGIPELDSDEEAEEQEYKRRAELRTAMIWFRPKKEDVETVVAAEGEVKQGGRASDTLVPDDTQLGVYRALFPSNLNQPTTFLPALRSIQFPSTSSSTNTAPTSNPNPESESESYPYEHDRIYTLLMVAGGHFAGMVVSLKPLNLNPGKGGGKPDKQDVKGAGTVRVLKHKTFHRYTTRKKQGGEQGDNDNAKGKANSAGAMLRRYGAQSLREEIQALMIEWEDEIRASERIFIRTSAMGRKSFYGYSGAVLDKADERIRVFPFPTRRPTQSELLRCFHELTKVKITHLTDAEIRILEEAYIASLQPKTTKPLPSSVQSPTIKQPAAPKLSAEEEAYRDLRERSLDMVRKGRLEALQSFWEKHGGKLGGVDARMEDWVEDGSQGQTMLMVASRAGQEDIVRWLLEDKRADPTLSAGVEPAVNGTEPSEDIDAVSRSGSDKRTAYDFSSTKEVRNVFRRLAFSHPDWFDWLSAGHVPSGLSEEKEQEQEKRKLDRRKGLKEKAKEREAKKAAEAPAVVETKPVPPAVASKPSSGPQKLGGGRPGVSDTGLAGLTPEMRAKIERERRARAAEARLTGAK